MSSPSLPWDHDASMHLAGPLQQTVSNFLISIISSNLRIPPNFQSDVRYAMEASQAEKPIHSLVNLILLLVEKMRERMGIEEPPADPPSNEMPEGVITAPYDDDFQPKPEPQDFGYPDEGEDPFANFEPTPVSPPEKSRSATRENKRKLSASSDSKKAKNGKGKEKKAKETSSNKDSKSAREERAKKRARERIPSPEFKQNTDDYGGSSAWDLDYEPPNSRSPRAPSNLRSPPPKMILKMDDVKKEEPSPTSSPTPSTPADPPTKPLAPIFANNCKTASKTGADWTNTKPSQPLPLVKHAAPTIVKPTIAASSASNISLSDDNVYVDSDDEDEPAETAGLPRSRLRGVHKCPICCIPLSQRHAEIDEVAKHIEDVHAADGDASAIKGTFYICSACPKLRFRLGATTMTHINLNICKGNASWNYNPEPNQTTRGKSIFPHARSNILTAAEIEQVKKINGNVENFKR